MLNENELKDWNLVIRRFVIKAFKIAFGRYNKKYPRNKFDLRPIYKLEKKWLDAQKKDFA